MLLWHVMIGGQSKAWRVRTRGRRVSVLLVYYAARMTVVLPLVLCLR